MAKWIVISVSVLLKLDGEWRLTVPGSALFLAALKTWLGLTRGEMLTGWEHSTPLLQQLQQQQQQQQQWSVLWRIGKLVCYKLTTRQSSGKVWKNHQLVTCHLVDISTIYPILETLETTHTLSHYQGVTPVTKTSHTEGCCPLIRAWHQTPMCELSRASNAPSRCLKLYNQGEGAY